MMTDRGTVKSTNDKYNVLDLIKNKCILRWPRCQILTSRKLETQEFFKQYSIPESDSVPQNNSEKEAKRTQTTWNLCTSDEIFWDSSKGDLTSTTTTKEEEMETARYEGREPNLRRFQAMVLTTNRNMWDNPYLGRDWRARGRSSSQGYGHAKRPIQTSRDPPNLRLELLISSRHVLLYEV